MVSRSNIILITSLDNTLGATTNAKQILVLLELAGGLLRPTVQGPLAVATSSARTRTRARISMMMIGNGVLFQQLMRRKSFAFPLPKVIAAWYPMSYLERVWLNIKIFFPMTMTRCAFPNLNLPWMQYCALTRLDRKLTNDRS